MKAYPFTGCKDYFATWNVSYVTFIFETMIQGLRGRFARLDLGLRHVFVAIRGGPEVP